MLSLSNINELDAAKLLAIMMLHAICWVCRRDHLLGGAEAAKRAQKLGQNAALKELSSLCMQRLTDTLLAGASAGFQGCNSLSKSGKYPRAVTKTMDSSGWTIVPPAAQLRNRHAALLS